MCLGSSHPTPSPSLRAAFPKARQIVQLGGGEKDHGQSVQTGWGKTGSTWKCCQLLKLYELGDPAVLPQAEQLWQEDRGSNY